MLIKKIQFGIPITIIRGGIKAVKTVISYPIQPNVPRDQATPMSTIIMEMNVARRDLKNKKKINEVTAIAPKTKIPISSTIF